MDAPTTHRQVGTHEDVLVFERDLVELTAHLGRPHLEIRGYRLFEEGTRELAFQLVCQVRGVTTSNLIQIRSARYVFHRNPRTIVAIYIT
jgi:hypothetical protein